MSKSFRKLLALSAVAGAAAYGTYLYLQKKDTESVPADADDELDAFTEDLDGESNPAKERSYVSINLDKAEAAFQKAKGVFTDSVQQVKDTVKNVAEKENIHSFTDLSETIKEKASDVAASVKRKSEDIVADMTGKAAEAADAAADVVDNAKEAVADAAEEVKDAAEEAAEEVAKEVEETAAEAADTTEATIDSVKAAADNTAETVEEFFDDEA